MIALTILDILDVINEVFPLPDGAAGRPALMKYGDKLMIQVVRREQGFTFFQSLLLDEDEPIDKSILIQGKALLDAEVPAIIEEMKATDPASEYCHHSPPKQAG